MLGDTTRTGSINNDLTIMWIPEHEGFAGIETADVLSRKGSKEKFIGPEPFCGCQIFHFKERLKKWEKRKSTGSHCRSQSRILIKY